MNLSSQNLKVLKPPGLEKSSRGFSLFELVVFIISVAIIYAFAANRFTSFPAQAERANFIAITTQLQSSLNLELMTVLARGRGGMAGVFEGINPMDLLLQPPANYLGSFRSPDPSRMDRRSWYFDAGREELVYLINDMGGVFLDLNNVPIPTQEIRFKVRIANGEVDKRTGLDTTLAERAGNVPRYARQSRVSGVLLQPIIPFIWGDFDESEGLIEPAIATN